MKINCSNCSARYSIADEKVAGRVVKVRCKKCGDAIVVRGDEAVWHSSIDGEQLGPFTSGELGAHLGGNGSAFVWREGFCGWVEARDVADLAHLFDQGATDLFAPQESEIFASSEEPVTPTEASHLTGERNESSVLFSLSNLSALSNEPRRANNDDAKPATGDGSGLIDIRALATALATSPAPSAEVVEDLLSFGGSDLASPLGAPVVVPERERSPGKLPIVIGSSFAAVVALAAAAVVAVVQLREPATHPEADDRALVDEVPALVAPIEPGAIAQPVSEPSAISVVTDPEPAVVPEAEPAETPLAHRPRTPRPRPTQVRPAPEPTRPLTPAPPEDDPLAGILAPRQPRPVAHPDPDLPETPSRGDITSAMNGVTPAVRACADGNHGAALVNASFGSDGRVRSVDVTGSLAGPVRSCVATAVRTARVPEFSRPSFRVNYPFRL